MVFLPTLLLSQTEAPIPGWTSDVYIKGSERGSEHRKGRLIVNALVHSFTSAQNAKLYDLNVLGFTNAAQYPVKSKRIEATGLRLFEFHSYPYRPDGKRVLDPYRSVLVRGSIGRVAYRIRAKIAKEGSTGHAVSRDKFIREVETFVTRFVAIAKPSPTKDPTVYPSLTPPIIMRP